MFNQLSRDIHSPNTAKQLSDLLSMIKVVQIYGPVDAPVAGVTTDSRAVSANWVFVALEGLTTDGHNFIQQAIEAHASVVVIQRKQYEEFLANLLSASYAQHTQTTVVVVEDTRAAVADFAREFYGNPAGKMRMIGITGTNGKTTSAYYIRNILASAGETVGMMGTIEYSIGSTHRKASLTTPMAESIQASLAEMVDAGCTSCVMEVSSHALALQRVHGISYDVALYTNLSRDHLDFHGTFEAYAAAKALLFSEHAHGARILNLDDQYQVDIWSEHDEHTKTYGTSKDADVRVSNVELDVLGTKFNIEYGGNTYAIRTHLVGTFNALNAAGAFASGVAMGMKPEDVIRGIESLENVPGRLQRISGPSDINGFVDYSHTPDSLQKALQSLNTIKKQNSRVIAVFGCGGDRDKGKRPMMGKVASEHADYIIVTNDNPRTESPEDIINAIMNGIEDRQNTEIVPDRRQAIRRAVEVAGNNDIILVAGKGHEDYQILGTERIYFSDAEELEAAFAARTEEDAR